MSFVDAVITAYKSPDFTAKRQQKCFVVQGANSQARQWLAKHAHEHYRAAFMDVETRKLSTGFADEAQILLLHLQKEFDEYKESA